MNESVYPDINPALASKLRQLRLDRTYVRATGSIMTDSEGRDVIDLIGQFGALPFGHNPPTIWEAINVVRLTQAPVMAGLSLQPAASRLADA